MEIKHSRRLCLCRYLYSLIRENINTPKTSPLGVHLMVLPLFLQISIVRSICMAQEQSLPISSKNSTCLKFGPMYMCPDKLSVNCQPMEVGPDSVLSWRHWWAFDTFGVLYIFKGSFLDIRSIDSSFFFAIRSTDRSDRADIVASGFTPMIFSYNSQ